MKEQFFQLKSYVLILAVIWTIIFAVSLAWNMVQIEHNALSSARIQARAAYNKDLIYRRWNTSHGGVYVPVTEMTQPNPYLSGIDEKDITTLSGKQLTLINPATMTRNVFELTKVEYGLRGHITSLNPIRAENAPDPWEAKALRAFEKGEREISSIEEIESQEYMRLMSPLITEKKCLKCHAKQGYKEGDIRGGISVSVPMGPLRAIAHKNEITLVLAHALLWLAGLAGGGLGAWRLKESKSECKRTRESGEKAYTRLEEQSALLAQSEKTAAVGTLVAGTAHELNNPLTAVLNFSAHCRKHTSKDDELYPVLEDIEYEAKRCADIVRNLATFSDIGQDDDVYEKASLAKIIGRVFELLSWRIENEGISTTLDVAEDTPDIWMNTTAVQQLILNLATNAFDALEGSEKKEFNVDIHREGQFVRMTISDTGCGIAAESLGLIFDPFFTTKPVGQGVGLGLSACQGIIKAHGGQISCQSKLGAGTKFIILLPIERSKQNERANTCN